MTYSWGPATGIAVDLLAQGYAALLLGPLIGFSRQAILPAVEGHHRQRVGATLGIFGVKQVERVLHPLRQVSHKLVVRDVEKLGGVEHGDLLRQAPRQLIVRHHELVQISRHLANAGRDAPVELVVGEDDDGGRGVPQVVRDGGVESVVVQENSVEGLVEELRGQLPFKLVVPEIQVPELRQLQHHLREVPYKTVVAHVQLEQELQILDLLWDDPAEPVGIEMKKADISQVLDLRGEMPRDVPVVEVNAGHHVDASVVQGLGADDAVVAAHVGALPIGCEAIGIRVDGFFPGPEGYVGSF